MIEWSKTVYKFTSWPGLYLCRKLRISANQITVINHAITLFFGCYFFSRGTYLGLVLALGVCLINGYLDYLDGDLAREQRTIGKLGIWLDSGFDVIVQNAVMGSIALGCFKQGVDPIWGIVFLVINAANNFVSFNYNSTFGFDSDRGNEVFRSFMDSKPTAINRLFKNIIDPTSNYPALIFFTFRYWIAFGCLLNIMPLCFMAMTIINSFKLAVMWVIYALHLAQEKRLHIFQVLASLDEDRDEFYRLRGGQRV